MARIAVVADDLTGANDTGIQFHKRGLSTAVLLTRGESPAQVVVADSDSRRDDPETAQEKVKLTLENLILQNPRYWYKKIDSTLRGNLGAELEMMLNGLDVPFALVCPAFPATGRTVAGGLLLVKGTPVSETDFGKDPLNPISESCIARAISLQTSLPSAELSLSDLHQGAESCQRLIKEYLEQGNRIIIVDAQTEEDLALAGSILALWPEHPPLAVGSAGLAAYLPDFWYKDTQPVPPVLVIAGSVSNVTRVQADSLMTQGAQAFNLSPEHILRERDTVAKLAKDIARTLGQGKNVVVRTAAKTEHVQAVRELGQQAGLTPQATSAYIAEFLGLLAAEVLAQKPILSGLILTGGDIAVRVLAALEATSLDLYAEVAPGVPVVSIADGTARGVKLVTKAGGFGSPDVLLQAVIKLRELWQ